MAMTPEGRELLKRWEGLRLYTYDDATGKRVGPGERCIGTLTAGYGHTGPDVIAGMTVTREMAEAWLDQDIARMERHVDGALKVKLSPKPRDACISLCFNIGPGRKGVRDGFVTLKSGRPSSVLRAINEERWTDVPTEWMKWVYVRGQISTGLVKRRAAELAELWVVGDIPASSAAKVEPPKPKPVALDPSVVPAVATGVAGLVVAARQVTEVMRELSESLVPLFGASVAVAIASVVVVFGTLWWGYRIYQRRRAEAG